MRFFLDLNYNSKFYLLLIRNFYIYTFIVLNLFVFMFSMRDKLIELESNIIAFKTSNKHNKCIVDIFYNIETNCNNLSDIEKDTLAFKMTICYYNKLNKPLLIKKSNDCKLENVNLLNINNNTLIGNNNIYNNNIDLNKFYFNCIKYLEGDSWSTYLSISSHIDNACFYYKMINLEQAIDIKFNSIINNTDDVIKSLELNKQLSNEFITNQINANNELEKMFNKTIKEFNNLTIIAERYNDFEYKFNNSLNSLYYKINNSDNQIDSIYNFINKKLDTIKLIDSFFNNVEDNIAKKSNNCNLNYALSFVLLNNIGFYFLIFIVNIITKSFLCHKQKLINVISCIIFVFDYFILYAVKLLLYFSINYTLDSKNIIYYVFRIVVESCYFVVVLRLLILLLFFMISIFYSNNKLNGLDYTNNFTKETIYNHLNNKVENLCYEVKSNTVNTPIWMKKFMSRVYSNNNENSTHNENNEIKHYTQLTLTEKKLIFSCLKNKNN